jgi:hypothetical protein
VADLGPHDLLNSESWGSASHLILNFLSDNKERIIGAVKGRPIGELLKNKVGDYQSKVLEIHPGNGEVDRGCEA